MFIIKAEIKQLYYSKSKRTLKLKSSNVIKLKFNKEYFLEIDGHRLNIPVMLSKCDQTMEQCDSDYNIAVLGRFNSSEYIVDLRFRSV